MSKNSIHLYTRSKLPDWDRIVYLKVMEGAEAIAQVNDPETCKIILVLEGSAGLRCNNQSLTVLAPALLCLSQTDGVVFDGTDRFNCAAVYFRPNVINDSLDFQSFAKPAYDGLVGTTLFQDMCLLNFFYGIECEKKVLTFLDGSSSYFVNSLIQKIKWELAEQKDGYWPCRSRSYFIELLFYLQRFSLGAGPALFSPPGEYRGSEFVLKIINYVNQNMGNNLSLARLEKEFAVNRNILNGVFKKELKTTIMKYITNMRMQLAGGLLRDTEIPINEVAIRVGYSDLSYFSKLIKSHYGKSAGEFRRSPGA